ncbi:MerR family DNA-binding transcriptional regulator [Microbacterium sp.]|uniref:MerR family DNA-binding transcriptional regulator n=1 Tax=Microbacterium sp. TaxID=51671 RepID=UPI00356262DF
MKAPRHPHLAARADVKVSTIRFYERAGLLPTPHRSANGYREFDEEDVRHVRFLRRGQELGAPGLRCSRWPSGPSSSRTRYAP